MYLWELPEGFCDIGCCCCFILIVGFSFIVFQRHLLHFSDPLPDLPLRHFAHFILSAQVICDAFILHFRPWHFTAIATTLGELFFSTHWCFTPCTYFPHFGTFVTQTRAGISYLGYFSVPPLEEFSLPSSAWAWTTDFWVTRPLVCLIALDRLSLLKVICKKNKTIWRSVGERYCL